MSDRAKDLRTDAPTVDRGTIRPDVDQAVTDVVRHANRLEPRVGTTRIIAIDGLSGAGKSTVARSFAAQLGTVQPGVVQVLHLDDLYEGWSGLTTVGSFLRDHVVVPLRHGEDISYRPYDWTRDRRGERTVVIARPDFLIIDGCGSAAREISDAISLLVWVDAPTDELDHRLRSRPDWPWYEQHLAGWRAQEAVLHRRDNARERAHVLVDTGPRPSAVLVSPSRAISASLRTHGFER